MENNTDRQFVYIDESGDLGFAKSRSSRYIVVSIVIFDSVENKQIDAEIARYRKELGWNELDEFHFKSTNKRYVAELLNRVSQYDFAIYSFIIDKDKYAKKHKILDAKHLSIKIVSDLLKELPLSNPHILIDGKYGKKFVKSAKTAIRKSLAASHIKVRKLDFVDSRKSNGVQLADLVAGAIARSFTEKHDSQKYLNIVKSKIVRKIKS